MLCLTGGRQGFHGGDPSAGSRIEEWERHQGGEIHAGGFQVAERKVPVL